MKAHPRFASPAIAAASALSLLLLLCATESWAASDRIIMYTSQEGVNPIRVLIFDGPSRAGGHVIWEGATQRVAEFSISPEAFEKLWARLISSGAIRFPSNAWLPSGKKKYVFSTGESPRGINKHFAVPKTTASPAVVSLAREFEAIMASFSKPGAR